MNPGDDIRKEDVYEVWGDMVTDGADYAPQVIAAIHEFFDDANLIDYFKCRRMKASYDQHDFLTFEWGSMQAHVDARPFGAHLDVYAILAVRQKLVDVPDPAARIARLEVWERRHLQIFQTLLKQAMEIALEKLDEGLVTL